MGAINLWLGPINKCVGRLHYSAEIATPKSIDKSSPVKFRG